jgi:hypothetical protein
VHSNKAITLRLTATTIDAYCRDLARRSPTLEKRVAAIDALITFISTQTEPGEKAKEEFLSIRQTLLDHFEQAREALLDERAGRLREALQAHRPPQIAMLYAALSRDAFRAVLDRVSRELDADAMRQLRDWASGWLGEARQRAAQASLYPDAIDFKAAGIDVSEYLAMTDLCRYLGVV